MKNKIFQSKKGMAENWPADTMIWWIVFCIVAGFTAVFFLLIVSRTGSEQATIHGDIELKYIMQRFFTSPTCFVLDKEGITSIRTIDIEKFNEDRLENCYRINDNRFPAFRLTLSSISPLVNKVIKTKNWLDGRSYNQKISQDDIVVYSNGELIKGEFEIEIQTQ